MNRRRFHERILTRLEPCSRCWFDLPMASEHEPDWRNVEDFRQRLERNEDEFGQTYTAEAEKLMREFLRQHGLQATAFMEDWAVRLHLKRYVGGDPSVRDVQLIDAASMAGGISITLAIYDDRDDEGGVRQCC